MKAGLQNRLNASIFSLTLALVCFTLAVKVGTKLWLDSYLAGITSPTEYSYIGLDYPEAWPIDVPDVLMASDASMHFKLDTPDGVAEWAGTIPGGDGLVYLGPHRTPYTVSMFHQLRCLDIIRAETLRERANGTEPTALARHCLNYIKSMVLCRGDLQLEPFLISIHDNPIDLFGTYECRDWSAVYREVENNQREYARWLESGEAVTRRSSIA